MNEQHPSQPHPQGNFTSDVIELQTLETSSALFSGWGPSVESMLAMLSGPHENMLRFRSTLFSLFNPSRCFSSATCLPFNDILITTIGLSCLDAIPFHDSLSSIMEWGLVCIVFHVLFNFSRCFLSGFFLDFAHTFTETAIIIKKSQRWRKEQLDEWETHLPLCSIDGSSGATSKSEYWW